MATELLPDYVASAKPSPMASRAAWFKNTAPTYAGIMLWFVFWQGVPVGDSLPGADGYSFFAGGMLGQGLGVALAAVVVAALICHVCFYLVPGMLGMRTGLPLYVVGTSTYGVRGGFLMPGFLMGVLQFGWLAVNAYFSSNLLCKPLGQEPGSGVHTAVVVVWTLVAAFMGLKGIQYVAKVATYLPLVPLVILLVLAGKTISGVASFNHTDVVEAAKQGFLVDLSEQEQQDYKKREAEAAKRFEEGAAARAKADAEFQASVNAEKERIEKLPPDKRPPAPPLGTSGNPAPPAGVAKPAPTPDSQLTFDPTKQRSMRASKEQDVRGILFLICTYIVGFFATAGAAGADFGMNNRNASDVQLGGLVGVAGSTIFAGGLSLLIVAGAYGCGLVPLGGAASMPKTDPTALMGLIVGDPTAKVFWVLLALAAFPPACFSSFIAANSFKTTLPKVSPFISCGIGAAAAIALAVSGKAGNAVAVFKVIGASFGPVCGAMVADYLLAGRRWAGPRAGFNPAGWISWIVGFLVGAADFFLAMATSLAEKCGAQLDLSFFVGVIPCPPVAAFIVGFLLYYILAAVGLQSRTLPMPQAEQSA